MIQLLATRYPKHIAYILFLIFTCTLTSVHATSSEDRGRGRGVNRFYFDEGKKTMPRENVSDGKLVNTTDRKNEKKSTDKFPELNKGDIGGPSQPEMSSFKSVGVDNLVNLFTGDFSYNIPLLDVGGYPVNIFYDASISPEQEASWVGLGWNINPGTVSRNMRGLPDDFNGDDKMIQVQKMKPNYTWGFNGGADVELTGIDVVDISLGRSIGFSYNNYLGPAIDIGMRGRIGTKLATNAGSEKNLAIGAGINANINSRNGLTLSPHLSLTASSFANIKNLTVGGKVSTSYNSRVGIKQLQISEQMSYNIKSGNDHADYYLNKFSSQQLNTPITFAKPTYLPALRMPITNESRAGRYELGTGILGVKGSVEVDAYVQVARVSNEDVIQRKEMVGYLYYEKAKDKPNRVMDFTRFNDNEVMPKTSIISVPQYAYDVFSIQGEGTGGSIRAYRNDLGYVRDIETRSKDKSFSAGLDIAPLGHFGANFSQIKTPTYFGDWVKGNNLKNAQQFQFQSANKDFENVYFRNPGETSVLSDNQFTGIGGTDLVRFKLGGTNTNPTVEPVLERFSRLNAPVGTPLSIAASTNRKKRTQVTSFLTAEEADKIGLDTKIRNYQRGEPFPILNADNTLNSAPINRFDPVIVDADEPGYEQHYRRAHHISQINVTESDGRRYVYGLPVYNVIQKDFSFSVPDTDKDADFVDFEKKYANAGQIINEPGLQTSPFLSSGSEGKGKDGFVQETTMPAYAQSFLLTGLLSPDYVDVTGNGITEDDLGDAVKFNYSFTGLHQWSTPLGKETEMKANFNAGNRSEAKDDKGMVTWGKRESWYLHSIESKTMIAIFTLDDVNRKDGKGSKGELLGVDPNDNTQRSLKKIDLYSKPDIKKNGLGPNGAKPIKTVVFQYSHALCQGSPDNTSTSADPADKGKLTLTGIYFTFNGRERTVKNRYAFSYNANPAYAPNSSDRWGTYKPTTDNPSQLKNSIYPYSSKEKAKADPNAAPWSLKTILLPSGGQIEVEYESDDYAFVQNKRAAVMTKVLGFSKTKNINGLTSALYSWDNAANGYTDNNYVFIEVPDITGDIKELKAKYLQGVDQLAFKLSVNMPKGIDEFITCYASIDDEPGVENFGKSEAASAIWIKLKPVKINNKYNGPLTVTVFDYLREQLPGQAFTAYDLSEDSKLEQIEKMLKALFEEVSGAFRTDILKRFREIGQKAQTINPDKSFVRLNAPNGYKYGGGHRVKSVKLKDNWKEMTKKSTPGETGQYTSEYSQVYNYETTEVFEGKERKISSGVASYEPSIGGEENPFQTIVQITDQVPLGPASIGSIEMPVLDAFFPAPVVGYSKVTVTSVGKNPNPQVYKSRSGIGKQVTEFYTAKDFPVFYQHTPLQPDISDKVFHRESKFNFFSQISIDSRAISQGFLVETNDMHGKLKSQASYAEGDDKTPINYTENFYRNTGRDGFEEFDFVFASDGGTVRKGNMGVDIELMTDVREFSVKSYADNFQGQADLIVPPAGWGGFLWYTYGKSEDTYRAVTTTKVINYHAVLESVKVIDKGSMVTTKNMVFDSETGQVVVTETKNEFELPVYNVSYPAYWGYSGMSLAYKNINTVYSDVEFRDGKVFTGMTNEEIKNSFESGDELYIINSSASDYCTAQFSGNEDLIWAFNKHKNKTSGSPFDPDPDGALTDADPDFVFMDKNGKLYTRKNVSFRIVRSGKRNMLNATVAGISLMANPVFNGKLTVDLNNNSTANNSIVNASAVVYKEKWKAENDVIGKRKLVLDNAACIIKEVEDCDGYLEKSINPYTKGLLGNFKVCRNVVFYGYRKQKDPLVLTSLSKDGFLEDFSVYWNFSPGSQSAPASRLEPNVADPNFKKWISNVETTKFNSRGLELETKDANAIFTAAQYGYSKTLPVAIANNSRYDNMMYEGFEDSEYQGNLNPNSGNNCFKRHFDFEGVANTSLVNTDLTTGLNAHSGKFVLKVNPTSSGSAIKSIDLNQEGSNDGPYIFNMIGATTGSLNDPGVFDVSLPYYTNKYNSSPTAPLNYEFWTSNGFNVRVTPTVFNSTSDNVTFQNHLHYELISSAYFEIKEKGNYILKLGVGNNVSEVAYNNAQLVAEISPVSGSPLGIFYCSPVAGQNSTSTTYPVCLDKGIYKIKFRCIEHYDRECSASSGNCTTAQNIDVQLPYREYNFSIVKPNATNVPIATGYKSLNSTVECSYTQPIFAIDPMITKTFSLPINKKMFLSAWVFQGGYAGGNIQLEFDNISQPAFLPTGPVIEGWQRIEGVFTVPETVTSVKIKLINPNGQPIYFDDIRIHPFNANMKSYVYDPVNLRLTAELDANNYATFYEYDAEGSLIRTKTETKEGVKTLNETRSFKQEKISAPVQ